jgi:Na+-driven multidrug efflux pump
MFSSINVVMKILSVFGLLIVSLIIGFIMRILIRNKPKTELVTWVFLIVFWLFFFIYSLVLTIQEDTPLFTKHHMANECFVIASILFLVVGFIFLRNNKKRLFGKSDETMLLGKNDKS